ncbi:MAG: hypothetical protein K0S07_668, partial [Chlamydiales bacterium]|nr:hypothetical protein [Chlamydiales bacterium]
KQGVTSLIQAFLPINQRWKDSSLTFQPSIHSDFFVDPERLAQRNGNALSKSESIDWQAFPNKECTQFGPKGYAVYTLPELIYYRAGSSPIPMALPHHYSLCPISDRLKRQTLLTHQTWALSSDALYLLCQKAKNTPFTLCRYSLENGQLEKKIPLSIIGSQLNQLRANEHLVAFATSEQKIHLYDQELIPLQALHLTDLFPPERAIKGFSEFSLHGDHLIVVSQAFKEISIWHLEKKLVRCLPLTGKTLNAFQAAGPFLALALDHRHIELFDLQTGNLLARLTLSEKMWDTGPWQQGSCWQAPFLFKEEEGQMSLAVLLESGRLEAWSSHL